jgi:D-alanyl-D-alanine carboxypeptidase
MSSKQKKVRLRTDRIVVLVVGLVILLALIVLLLKVPSGQASEPTSAQNTTTDTVAEVVSTDTSDTTPIDGDGLDPTYDDTTEPTEDSQETTLNESAHVVEVVDGCTYIDGLLIINKSYSVPADYQGYNGGLDDTKPTPPQGLFPEVIDAFNLMQAQAESEGLDVYIASGYRSYYYQQNVYNRYCEYDSPEVVDTYSARAGYSEHQSGYAFDLNSIDDSFADTAEGQWIAENCYKYGFVIRFPEGKEDITGYQYESWHLRYVGVDVATYMYENNLCLEEYLGVDSVYAD